jgi:hypothetical protein
MIDPVLLKDELCARYSIPDRLVDETTASIVIGMSKKWFQRARWSGEYPDLEYVKFGNAVRYWLSALYRFADGRRTKNTSEIR